MFLDFRYLGNRIASPVGKSFVVDVYVKARVIQGEMIVNTFL